MNEAVKAIDFLNLATMLVIPVAGVGYLCWRGFRESSLRKHTPTTFFEKDYVPTIAPLLKNGQKQAISEQPKPAKKIIPITAAIAHSR